MSRFSDWWASFGGKKETGIRTASKALQPIVPPLDTTPASLTGYATKSELVYACIDKKAQAACDPELIIQTKNSKGDWDRVDGHPAMEAFLNPNPWDDAESFLRTWIASENIAGEFYAEIGWNAARQPVRLYPLRPDFIVPMYKFVNGTQVIDYYSYQFNGTEIRYQPEELFIHRRHGLGSLYSGRSPLSVALNPVDADIAATEYIRAFYNNGGTPSGILTVKGRRMSQEEADHLGQMWSGSFARQGKKRGGTAVLDENAEYQTVGSNLAELNSEALTSIEETRICMAFGVPPVLIGAYVGLKNVNQKASFKGAMEEFWGGTMSPELKQLRMYLTHKWLPMFGEEENVRQGNIRFFWDMSNVAAMQEDIDLIYDRTVSAYKSGIMKLDEARTQIKLDPVGEEMGGEEFYTAPAPISTGTDPNNPDGEGDGRRPPKHDITLPAGYIQEGDVIKFRLTPNGSAQKKTLN